MTSTQVPRKRGRPRKNPEPETIAPATLPGRIKSSAPAVPIAKPRGHSDFYFRLHNEGISPSLDLVDRNGKAFAADYRQYTGLLREAIRTFYAERAKSAGILHWETSENAETECSVHVPSTHLVDLALETGVLQNADGTLLVPEPGEFHIDLSLVDSTKKTVTVRPVLVNEDGDTVLWSNDGFSTVSSVLVRSGSRVFRVPDLGPWRDRFDYKSQCITRETLESYLSIIVSVIPSLTISAEGFVVQRGKPVLAQASLLFKEIDKYGFLHIRPLVHLEGYPPGFLEDQELVQIVRIDTEENSIRLAEVVFPERPSETFRKILAGAGKQAQQAIYEENGYFILETGFAARFLEEYMGELISRFILIQSNLLSRYRVKIVQPKLRLSLGSGIDYFAGAAEIDLDGEVFSFGRFMAEYRKEGFITLNDGTRAFPERKELERYNRLITKTKGRDDAVSVSFFDIPALRQGGMIEAEGEGWDRAEKFFRGFNTITEKTGDYEIPDATLRPYQVYGIKWLEYLRDHQLGGCLADEMGLGKTVQVITLLRKSYAGGMEGASLILVPRTLIFNWQAELARFAPDLPIHVHYGIDRDPSLLSKAGNKVILSSYATIRNDIEFLKEISFSYVILDESQNIKNLETRTAGAVLSLVAEHRIAMSGTPIENSLSDLYSLFRFLNPAFFGGQSEFMRQYLRPIQEKQDEDALHDLKARVYPFMLRRIKRDVLADLPPKTEQTALIELHPVHLALYNRRRDELQEKIRQAVKKDGVPKSAFLILQALGELRRLAGVPEADWGYVGVSAKREYLKDMVSSISAEGHKSLIFTNFLASVDLVSEDLAEAGIGNLVMTGATRDRQSLVRQFQNDPEIRSFVMTLKTGGVGLNLTAADYVFIFDPWWNRAAESQAIDRTHRIGQTNPVFCYRMIARDTIEERILELQERKADLVSSLLTSDANAVKALSEDDIEYLLG